jgi:membrane-bound metal-dependent hydrolase YbcI (DUF457 family)
MTLFLIFLANAPDLDYLAGIGRNLNDAHHYYTHTIGWSFLLALALMLACRQLLQLEKTGALGFYFALIFSHVFLDLFSLDFSEPRGVMILWPFYGNFIYHDSWTFFLNLEKQHVHNLFSLHNAKAIFLECLVLGQIVMMTAALRMYGKTKPLIQG